jgi:hypothetical protein
MGCASKGVVAMAQQLADAPEVQYNGEPFGNENHEAATRELIQLWNESNGQMSFRDMEDRGEWSRTMYRNMMEYVEPVQATQSGARTRGQSDARQAMEQIVIPDNPVAAFVKGYQMAQEQ